MDFYEEPGIIGFVGNKGGILGLEGIEFIQNLLLLGLCFWMHLRIFLNVIR